jgi:hypothetical protein
MIAATPTAVSGTSHSSGLRYVRISRIATTTAVESINIGIQTARPIGEKVTRLGGGGGLLVGRLSVERQRVHQGFTVGRVDDLGRCGGAVAESLRQLGSAPYDRLPIARSEAAGSFVRDHEQAVLTPGQLGFGKEHLGRLGAGRQVVGLAVAGHRVEFAGE